MALRAMSKPDKPKKPKRKNEEHKIQRQIERYLFKHPLVGKAWRQNSGKVKTAWGSWFQGAPKGTSDIVGFLADGRFLAIEVKKPGEELTKKQQDFIDLVNDCGGLGFGAWSLDDVKDFIPPATQ